MRPLLATALISALLLTALSAEQPRQTATSFSTQVEKSLDFLLYLPADYEADKKKKWPLMVFLHGAGERGDDLEMVKVHGPPKKVAAGEDFPFILASPQCPKGVWWNPETVELLIQHLEKKHRVDSDRIYLTGLSMGGFGTWDTAMRYPHRFAAIAPICGGGKSFLAREITHLPTWVFHGTKDRAVPITQSEEMVNALKARGNQQVKFTIYEGVGHDSWTESYDNPELYEWMLSHTRVPEE